MTQPKRPCGVCRQPVPDGNCPKHPRSKGGYRPGRPSVVAGTYGRRWQRVRLVVLTAAGWRCGYCHASAGTADHVIPVPRGGTHALSNLVAACHGCNTSKGERTLAEWCASGLAPGPARTLLAARRRAGLPS